jgi:hypothetical protein
VGSLPRERSQRRDGEVDEEKKRTKEKHTSRNKAWGNGKLVFSRRSSVNSELFALNLSFLLEVFYPETENRHSVRVCSMEMEYNVDSHHQIHQSRWTTKTSLSFKCIDPYQCGMLRRQWRRSQIQKNLSICPIIHLDSNKEREGWTKITTLSFKLIENSFEGKIERRQQLLFLYLFFFFHFLFV